MAVVCNPALCVVWYDTRTPAGSHCRMGVHSLVLSANNTGILAPVVLAAALGPEAAPLGMLATIALYFQQLPGASIMFEMQRAQCR